MTILRGRVLFLQDERKIGRLQQKREKSDYDDFYIASREETTEQIENAKEIIAVIRGYLEKEGLLGDYEKLF